MPDPSEDAVTPLAPDSYLSAVPQTDEEVAAIRSGQPAPLRKDERIPGYQFIRRLGKGGMGEVWLVDDIRRGRPVALKQMLNAEATDIERQRFSTEAQAMARMEHANIASIYHIAEHNGQPYFVMEYCAGGTLGDYLDRKPHPAKVCAEIAEAIARAVSHAHRASIVHRDLKPANVLMSRRLFRPGESASSTPSDDIIHPRNDLPVAFSVEWLKVTDFGLAKKLDSDEGATRTQAVMGTPSYMAPEQAGSAKRAGPQADVWAVGVILYEMITGGLPFVGSDSVEVIDNLRQKEAVAPSDKVAVPRDLETICLKRLRKAPADRYATAEALADDLRAFLDGRSISARPMSSAERAVRWVRKNPSWTALMTAVAASLLLGTGVSLLYAGRANDEAKQANGARLSLEAKSHELEASLENARRQTKFALDANNDMIYGVQNKLENLPGTQDLRTELLQNAHAGMKKILEEVCKQGTHDIILVWSHLQLGDVEWKLGNAHAARNQYQVGHEILLRLADADPQDLQVQRDLGATRRKLGDVMLRLGGTEVALGSYRKSLEAFQYVADADPKNSHAQRDVSILHSNIGDVTLQLGETEAAIDSYRKSLDGRHRDADSDVKNVHAKRELAILYEKMGSAHLKSYSYTEASCCFRNMIAIVDQWPDPKALELNMQFAHSSLNLCRVAEKAIADIEFVFEQKSTPVPELLTLRLNAMLYRKQSADAVATAERFASWAETQMKDRNLHRYGAACAFALYAKAIDKDREALVDKSLSLLAKAKAGGYFDAKKIVHIRQDENFDGIRKHPKFVEFIDSLDTTLEPGPMPRERK